MAVLAVMVIIMVVVMAVSIIYCYRTNYSQN